MASENKIAWRTIGVTGLKRFMTQQQYEAQSPSIKRWYEPFQCAHCQEDAWRNAVDEQLVTIGATADSFSSPREAVSQLLDWHLQVERDPKVSDLAADAMRWRALIGHTTGTARSPKLASLICRLLDGFECGATEEELIGLVDAGIQQIEQERLNMPDQVQQNNSVESARKPQMR
ncbi:hypothetical protein [Chitinibacter tainanensis]|uniref:hypothetical protein n=1 Tax=Chitinibacter tainanensis TaxID=230667 RepID=UPI00048E9DD0|nr:hypothetical protein [Chitinibacter tainanensis]